MLWTLIHSCKEYVQLNAPRSLDRLTRRTLFLYLQCDHKKPAGNSVSLIISQKHLVLHEYSVLLNIQKNLALCFYDIKLDENADKRCWLHTVEPSYTAGEEHSGLSLRDKLDSSGDKLVWVWSMGSSHWLVPEREERISEVTSCLCRGQRPEEEIL